MTSPDYEGLAELLLSLESETDSHPQKGRRLVNPDGPEAAAALRTVVAERDRLEERLRYSENIVNQTQGDMCPVDPDEFQRALAIIGGAALSGRKEP